MIAAVLNLFFGLGYVYLGYRSVLGVPTVVFVLVALIVFIILGAFSGGVASFVLAVVLAVDGWQKADGKKGFVAAQ